MALIPKNTNPLQDYLESGINPAMSVDGLVVDGVYAFTGVIDTISSQANNYQDPSTNQIYSSGQIILPQQSIPTQWVSALVDDVYNTGYSLAFKFDRETYINYVTMDLGLVPLNWELRKVNTIDNSYITLYTGVIESYNPTSIQNYQVKFSQTFEFDTNNDLVLVLTKLTTGTQYQMLVENFLTKLVVNNYYDITYDGGKQLDSLTTQSPLGFIETYTPYIDEFSNMYTTVPSGVDAYWKCSPQPVGDAVVFFVIDFGYKNSINTMYIDPLYTGNIMNIYSSNDNINWNPVVNDYSLRRGLYKLPTINSRYIKLEFTQLTPEPYNLAFDSVQKIVQVFPDWVDNYFSTIEQSIPDISAQSYYPLNSNQLPNTSYNTTPNISTTYGLAVNSLSNSATYGNNNIPNNVGNANFGVTGENYTILDPTVSYKSIQDIGNIGSVYSNNSNPTFISRRFYPYGPHNYKDITINQTWHQAYFTGIKYLSFYSSSQSIQDYREEYFDSFYAIVSGNTTLPDNNTIVNSTTSSGITLLPSGGYTGSANSYMQTNNLQSIVSYNSFKFAALNTDWQLILTSGQTLLQGSPNVTGVTASGVTIFSNTNNPEYGIYTLSGTNGLSYVQSALGGGSQNYLSSSMALFQTISGGGWTGNNPTSTTISGVQYTNLPLFSLQSWAEAYGDTPLATNPFGNVTSSPNTTPWVYLVTSSGLNGTVTISGSFYQSGVFVAASGSTFTVAASGTQISFPLTQPLNTNQASFSMTPSASTTFTKAGLFKGTTAIWSAPIQLKNMRVSAVARIYLPDTNFGTYRCSLYSSTGTELAYKQVNSLPLRTWIDIEVPYTILDSNYNTIFYIRLTQLFGYQNGIRENYRVAMLGIFYNPVNYQFSIDSGTTWWNISSDINDPNTVNQLPAASNQLMLKATILQDYTIINAIELVPQYLQNPYTNNTVIDYLSSSKSNETNTKTAAQEKPLFQLNSDLYPLQYSLRELFNITSPYIL